MFALLKEKMTIWAALGDPQEVKGIFKV